MYMFVHVWIYFAAMNIHKQLQLHYVLPMFLFDKAKSWMYWVCWLHWLHWLNLILLKALSGSVCLFIFFPKYLGFHMVVSGSVDLWLLFSHCWFYVPVRSQLSIFRSYWNLNQNSRFAVATLLLLATCLSLTSNYPLKNEIFSDAPWLQLQLQVCGTVKERQRSLDDNETWYGMKDPIPMGWKLRCWSVGKRYVWRKTASSSSPWRFEENVFRLPDAKQNL